MDDKNEGTDNSNMPGFSATPSITGSGMVTPPQVGSVAGNAPDSELSRIQEPAQSAVSPEVPFQSQSSFEAPPLQYPLNQPVASTQPQVPILSSQVVPQPFPQSGFESVPGTVKISEFKRQKFIKKSHQIILYCLGLLEGFLALRLLFKLLTAATSSEIVLWIFEVSDVFVKPFAGIVQNAGRGAHILDFTTLIAMGFSALVALALSGLVKLFAPTAPQKVWEE
ncbi:hypothetical protein KKB83_03695 [Patescibacteria group bacterium]|nr:hypothetical protein [Patescibacteria group bacterium]